MNGHHCENYDGKLFTVAREMLTAVARYQSVQLKLAWCCRRNLTAFFKICFCFVLLYNKSLNDWSLRKQWILFPSNLNVSLESQCFPRLCLVAFFKICFCFVLLYNKSLVRTPAWNFSRYWLQGSNTGSSFQVAAQKFINLMFSRHVYGGEWSRHFIFF